MIKPTKAELEKTSSKQLAPLSITTAEGVFHSVKIATAFNHALSQTFREATSTFRKSKLILDQQNKAS
ncbi:MAG: hypothetical protein ACI85Q_000444 [Salibacteraceae bacterium]